MSRSTEMLFSRRMLMVITPVGLAIGLYEAWRLAGGLVLLMALQISVLAAALVGLVRTVRRQSAQGDGKS
jgi:hypothetical protein